VYFFTKSDHLDKQIPHLSSRHSTKLFVFGAKKVEAMLVLVRLMITNHGRQ
jgi:hypothetical protein